MEYSSWRRALDTACPPGCNLNVLTMKIAIIGTGNVGGALATKWALAGHEIFLGTRVLENFESTALLENPNTSVHLVADAVKLADILLLASPADYAIEVARSLGNTTGKIIIDAMNIVMGKGPEGYTSTTEAVRDNTTTDDVVKCFNTTGFNNMLDPVYGDQILDMFMAGDSHEAKEVASRLALDAGFAACYDVGGNDKFTLMESFANFWINLAMFQGQGRDIGFKLLKR